MIPITPWPNNSLVYDKTPLYSSSLTFSAYYNVLNEPRIAIAWSPSLNRFSTVGDGRSQLPTGSKTTEYSTSGTGSWTISNMPYANTAYFTGIAWSDSLAMFAAFCGQGYGSTYSYVATSTTGLAWTFRQWLPYTISNTTGFIKFINGKFIISQSSQSNSLPFYSSDGITWTQSTLPGGGTIYTYHSIVYSPQLNVMIAIGDGILSGVDGTTWVDEGTVASKVPTSLGSIKDIEWVNSNRFVGVGDGGNIIYSLDGTNWQRINPANGNSGTNYRSIKWIPSHSKAIAFGDTHYMESTDGLSWYEYPCTDPGISDFAWATSSNYGIAIGAFTTSVYKFQFLF